MSIDKGIFEDLHPFRFISFTFPNPTTHQLSDQLLRIAVLDSPIQPTDSPRVAAILVPTNRENDWTFSTETGHRQLINSTGLSRLVLIGNLPTDGDHLPQTYEKPICNHEKYRSELEEVLFPLLVALSPKCSLKDGLPEVPFLCYEDNVIRSRVVEVCCGVTVGEILVEDVEIEDAENTGLKREYRRRLRFKRMPNLIQTEISIVPVISTSSDFANMRELEFKPEVTVLVHPYLPPMVASLSLISSYIEEQFQSGLRPKALCIGVGGGALLSFLKTQLGFEVMGVEEDEEVLRVARQYFGLESAEVVRVLVGDGLQVINKSACNVINGNSFSFSVDRFDTKVAVIMVDLDANDSTHGIVAPPLEFVQKDILFAARLVLQELGILVVNVIPSGIEFRTTLVNEFREVFQELYEIDVGNGENIVLIATVSPIRTAFNECKNYFLTKLKQAISGKYIDSIRKI